MARKVTVDPIPISIKKLSKNTKNSIHMVDIWF